MKQDQSYFGQVSYLREDNFGLNCTKECLLLKISYKFVALFTQNYPSPFSVIFIRSCKQSSVGFQTVAFWRKLKYSKYEEVHNNLIQLECERSNVARAYFQVLMNDDYI